MKHTSMILAALVSVFWLCAQARSEDALPSPVPGRPKIQGKSVETHKRKQPPAEVRGITPPDPGPAGHSRLDMNAGSSMGAGVSIPLSKKPKSKLQPGDTSAPEKGDEEDEAN